VFGTLPKMTSVVSSMVTWSAITSQEALLEGLATVSASLGVAASDRQAVAAIATLITDCVRWLSFNNRMFDTPSPFPTCRNPAAAR